MRSYNPTLLLVALLLSATMTSAHAAQTRSMALVIEKVVPPQVWSIRDGQRRTVRVEATVYNQSATQQQFQLRSRLDDGTVHLSLPFLLNKGERKVLILPIRLDLTDRAQSDRPRKLIGTLSAVSPGTTRRLSDPDQFSIVINWKEDSDTAAQDPAASRPRSDRLTGNGIGLSAFVLLDQERIDPRGTSPSISAVSGALQLVNTGSEPWNREIELIARVERREPGAPAGRRQGSEKRLALTFSEPLAPGRVLTIPVTLGQSGPRRVIRTVETPRPLGPAPAPVPMRVYDESLALRKNQEVQFSLEVKSQHDENIRDNRIIATGNVTDHLDISVSRPRTVQGTITY